MTPIEEIKWLIEEAQTLVEDNHARSAEYVLAKHGPKLLALVEAVECVLINAAIHHIETDDDDEMIAQLLNPSYIAVQPHDIKKLEDALAALKEEQE